MGIFQLIVAGLIVVGFGALSAFFGLVMGHSAVRVRLAHTHWFRLLTLALAGMLAFDAGVLIVQLGGSWWCELFQVPFNAVLALIGHQYGIRLAHSQGLPRFEE